MSRRQASLRRRVHEQHQIRFSAKAADGVVGMHILQLEQFGRDADGTIKLSGDDGAESAAAKHLQPAVLDIAGVRRTRTNRALIRSSGTGRRTRGDGGSSWRAFNQTDIAARVSRVPTVATSRTANFTTRLCEHDT